MPPRLPSGTETELFIALTSLIETGTPNRVVEIIGESQLDFLTLSEQEKEGVLEAIKKGHLIWFLVEKIQNIPLYKLYRSGRAIAIRNEDEETIFLSHSSQIPNRDHKAQMFWEEANFEINFSQKQIQIIPSNVRFIARDLDKAEMRILLPTATYLKDFLDCLIKDGFSVGIENSGLILSEGEDIITFIKKCTQQ